MPLRYPVLGSLGAACSILALALACGGGKSSSTPAPAPPISLAGAWTGISGGSSTNYVLVMPSDGSFRLLNSDMQVGASGSFQTSGATGLSGTITFVNSLTLTTTPLISSLAGTATSGSVNATISSTDPVLNNKSLTLTPDASAATGAQLSGLAGTWSSASSRNTDKVNLSFTLDAAGQFTGTMPMLNASGTFAQPTANANAFTADLTITQALGVYAGQPRNFRGTAYLRAGSGEMVLSADDGTLLFGGIFTRQ